MKIRLIKIIILLLFILCAYQVTSNAAILASSKTVNSGETVSIAITSNVPIVSYKVKVTNNAGLTFVSSSGGQGAGTETITDGQATTMTSLATFTYRVPNVTADTTYTLTFFANIMEDGNLNPVADSTTSATITVKAPVVAPPPPPSNNTNNNNNPNTQTTKKSDNSNLTSLSIDGIELMPAFSKGTKNYTAYVKNDITEVAVKATAEHAKASVSISGNKELIEGDNKVSITVKAEDGSTTTYYINVVREIKVPLALTKLEVEGFKLDPEFNPEIYEYTIELEEFLEVLKITAIAENENTPVEIIGAEDLKEGENIISIFLKSADGTEIKEYRIKVIVPAKIELLAMAEPPEEEQSPTIGPVQYVATVIVFIATGVMIGALILYYNTQPNKPKRQKKDNFGDVVQSDEEAIEERGGLAKIKEQEDLNDLEEAEEKKKVKGKHF